MSVGGKTPPAGSSGPDRLHLAKAGGLTTLGATLAFGGVAHADTFTVTNTADGPGGSPPAGSLRAAVQGARNHAGDDQIVFASGLSGTITLSGGSMSLANSTHPDPVEVIGPGAAQLAIDAGFGSRIFYAGGHYNPLPAVTISGLTLKDAQGPSYGYGGGAVTVVRANLTVAHSVISGSQAQDGGAIYCTYSGSLTVEGSTVSGNTATDSGAGIFSELCDTTIRGSTISDNTRQGTGLPLSGGGGIWQTYGDALIQNSTVTGNRALGGSGGGVGFDRLDNAAVIEHSTIASNRATSSGGDGGLGGGVYQSYNGVSPALKSTIVANNSASKGSDVWSEGPPFEAAFSLVEHPGATAVNGLIAGSNILGQDPQLGPLEDNGGPTQTIGLAPTSPAVDEGATFGLGSDQRGVTRPIDFPAIPNSTAPGADGSDIGAFELQPASGFTLGKLKLRKRKGTAVQTVDLPTPDAGSVTLSGKGLKTRTQPVLGGGILTLKVLAKGKVRRKLGRRGKAKATETVTYDPAGQTPLALGKKVKLLMRR